MMATLSARFSRALRALENERDLQPLVELFADDAEVSSPLLANPLHGIEGVRRLFKSYLERYAEVRSEFLRFVDSRDVSVIEWILTAKFPDGRKIEYCGATLLESQDERITRMQAYFDPRIVLEATRREPTPIRQSTDIPDEEVA